MLSVSACISASEIAIFSLPSIKVKTYKHESDPRKQLIVRLLASPRDVLITVIMINICANILIQNIVSSIFGKYSLWILSVGVPLAITLIFGEILPKAYGLANNEAVALRMARLINLAQKVLYPIRRVLNSITNVVSRVMFFFLHKEEEISVDELQHALAASRKYGVLNEEEAELVRGFLNLQEASVKQVMRPRDEVIYFDIEDSLPQLISLFVDKECSRVPVCRGGLDQVLGIMTSGVYFLYGPAFKNSTDIIPHLQKPFYAPESMSAKTLLSQLYEKNQPLAIVVDEYGSVSGLITVEDLVETVVGEIVDQRDEKKRFTRSGEDVIIASGKLELGEFEGIFGVPLESDSMVTLGGWLTEQIGDIPKTGTKYMTPDFLFQVLAADPNRVRRIYVRRLHHKGKS